MVAIGYNQYWKRFTPFLTFARTLHNGHYRNIEAKTQKGGGIPPIFGVKFCRIGT